jgi:hypothetical protein
MSNLREQLTREERQQTAELTIDPGFVHKRKIQTVIGQTGMEMIDAAISQLPELPVWERNVRIDHIYTDVMLTFCRAIKIKSLEEALTISCGVGMLICSTEELEPCKNIFKDERVISVWKPRKERKSRVEFHYSSELVTASTLKWQLSEGTRVSIVAELFSISNGLFVFHPLIIGFPWLRTDNRDWETKAQCYRFDFFENFIEDFDEFSKVNEHRRPDDHTPMKDISELAFKKCLATLLGDPVSKDWGGEQSDHFTSNIHLGGKRATAAFLLKGPARYAPMILNHLGKNNDQIVRLAQEPAGILFVQHCHEILPPVRSTLRAFAVQPSFPRRYCLIDGKDSLWLLNAYGLYDKALSWS